MWEKQNDGLEEIVVHSSANREKKNGNPTSLWTKGWFGSHKDGYDKYETDPQQIPHWMHGAR